MKRHRGFFIEFLANVPEENSFSDSNGQDRTDDFIHAVRFYFIRQQGVKKISDGSDSNFFLIFLIFNIR